MAELSLIRFSLFGLETYLLASFVFFLVIRCAWLDEVPALHRTSPPESNTLYSGQESNLKWSGQCDCVNVTLAEPAERTEQTAEQLSCTSTCIPQINVTLSPDKVSVTLSVIPDSLIHKFGGHIIYGLQYWKKNSRSDKQQLDIKSYSHTLIGLEPEQEYCFQVSYLKFHKPYGIPSQEVCRVIPESSSQRRVRVIVSGVLTVLGLACLCSCFYFIYIHHRRIKVFLELPVGIPTHYGEFLSGEFSQQTVSPSSTQELGSHDFIHLALENDEAEEEEMAEEERSVAAQD